MFVVGDTETEKEDEVNWNWMKTTKDPGGCDHLSAAQQEVVTSLT